MDYFQKPEFKQKFSDCSNTMGPSLPCNILRGKECKKMGSAVAPKLVND